MKTGVHMITGLLLKVMIYGKTYSSPIALSIAQIAKSDIMLRMLLQTTICPASFSSAPISEHITTEDTAIGVP